MFPMTDSGYGSADGTSAATTDQPEATPPPAIPFGEWPSPITAADVARGRLRLAFPAVTGGDIWWQETRPEQGGRTTVLRAAGGKLTELLPAPWNARSRVHEYGGQAYLPVPGLHSIVFASYADQRLYMAGPQVAEGKEQPRPLTPDPAATASESGGGMLAAAALRYADFVLSPDGNEVWCVHERHDGGKVTRAIVAVPLDGSAAEDLLAIRTMVAGADFFAYPTPSPDGKQLAWITWNHPHMPWDGTELRVAPIENGIPARGRLLQGSNRESVLAPLWRDNTSLYVVTDWSGWWNIYQLSLTGGQPQALYPADEEFAGPLWQLGGRPFAMLGDGRLAVVHGYGSARLSILDPESVEMTELQLPYTEFEYAIAADGDTIAGVAAGPYTPSTVVRISASTGRSEALRAELTELPDQEYLPAPQPVELEGPYGRVVHAFIYPPTNPQAAGPAGARPPFVVWVHGGPTGQVEGVFDLEKAFFTSRGIGVIDVNYGGSSGYGRLYRERLRRQWGVVDVEDAKSAATSLAEAGQADPRRLAIRGGSAGGWTALGAVTTGTARSAVFSAATSYFGVADLRDFAAITHDFESRYLDGLIGPLPGFAIVYEERAPVGHITSRTCPILLLQGLDDPVVPPSQSEAIATDLEEHGIPYAYIAFEGESHGFRKAESITTALEAELSFYGQVLGFTPPGIPQVRLTGGKQGRHAAQQAH
jgi:dipeptidyl aminopeptidase/acylaminoacyl peptidase